MLLIGRTKAEAFAIGESIAAAVSRMNPQPVKLKFEKVFDDERVSNKCFKYSLQVLYPCLLETKKRYVGYAYESIEQCEPTFDAKGIETVRRDTCGIVDEVRVCAFIARLRYLFSIECVCSHAESRRLMDR